MNAAPSAAGRRDGRFATTRVVCEYQPLFSAISRDDEHRLDQRRLPMVNLREDFLRRWTAERALSRLSRQSPAILASIETRVRSPAYRERPFRSNVNSDSARW